METIVDNLMVLAFFYAYEGIYNVFIGPMRMVSRQSPSGTETLAFYWLLGVPVAYVFGFVGMQVIFLLLLVEIIALILTLASHYSYPKHSILNLKWQSVANEIIERVTT